MSFGEIFAHAHVYMVRKKIRIKHETVEADGATEYRRPLFTDSPTFYRQEHVRCKTFWWGGQILWGAFLFLTDNEPHKPETLKKGMVA